MATRKKKTEQAAPTVEEPKKYPDPKIRSFRTELDVILTDEEIKQRGIQVAYLYRDIGRAENDLKELVKEKKADIAKIEMKLQGFADEVREGKRRDEVLCEETMHYDLLRVVQVRMDTGEEILNRPFSDEEAAQYKRPPLPFEKNNKPSASTNDVAVIGGEDDVDEGVIVDDDYPRSDGSEERDWPEKDDDEPDSEPENRRPED